MLRHWLRTSYEPVFRSYLRMTATVVLATTFRLLLDVLCMTFSGQSPRSAGVWFGHCSRHDKLKSCAFWAFMELALSTVFSGLFVWHFQTWGLSRPSRSSMSAGNMAKHFPGTQYAMKTGPTVKLKTASGQLMNSKGRFVIQGLTDEGHEACVPFVDADVDMPVISVAQLSKEGKLGSEVTFRKKDGLIRDIDSGRTTKFIKRQGVDFIRLRVRKPNGGGITDVSNEHAMDVDTGFARPAVP